MLLYYILNIYILIIGSLFGTGEQNKVKKMGCILFTFGLFTVLCAFRAETIGNDTHEYIRVFKIIAKTGSIAELTWRYEVGYLYLNKLVSMISQNPQALIILSSILIMYGFARFIYKYSTLPLLSIFLFFSLGYYGSSMNTIRINLAIVLVLFAYDYLKKKKLVKFIMLVLLATLFHRTAIIFLSAWFMTKLKYNFKTVSLICFGSLSLYIIFPVLLQRLLSIFPTYNYYMQSSYLNGQIRLASILNMFVGLSIILLGVFTGYHKNCLTIQSSVNGKGCSNSINKEIINDGQLMLIFLIFSVSITFLSFRFNLLSRVGDFYFAFSIIYLPNAIKNIKGKNFRALITYMVILLFLIYATLILILRPEWNRIYPYQFFWQYND